VFERTSRGVTLTSAGWRLLPYDRNVAALTSPRDAYRSSAVAAFLALARPPRRQAAVELTYL
jgi:hypothetical protein